MDAEETPVQKLERLEVRGILWQLARDGQIIDVRCEMPQCYCFRGRRYFKPRSSRSDWELTADHYPRLKMHGGHLTPDNVRLAHRLCNRRDYREDGDTYCSDLTTEEARALAEALDDGGQQGGFGDNRGPARTYRLEYRFDVPGPSRETIDIFLEPYLPHGEWTCSPCG